MGYQVPDSQVTAAGQKLRIGDTVHVDRYARTSSVLETIEGHTIRVATEWENSDPQVGTYEGHSHWMIAVSKTSELEYVIIERELSIVRLLSTNKRVYCLPEELSILTAQPAISKPKRHGSGGPSSR